MQPKEPFTLLRGGPFSKVVSKYEHLCLFLIFQGNKLILGKWKYIIHIRSRKRILLKAIYFETVLDLMSCKEYWMSRYIPFLTSFLPMLSSKITMMYLSTLRDWHCNTTINKPQMTSPQLPHFSNFPIMLLFFSRSSPGCHIAFSHQITLVSSSLWQFFCCFLPFITLIPSKTSQVFFQIPRNLSMSGIVSCINWDYGFCGEYHISIMPFSLHHIRGLVIYTQLIAGEFNLNHMVKVELPVKLLFFPSHALFLSPYTLRRGLSFTCWREVC